MRNQLFFFSIAIFSKSLLTVLGTLPSPAVNWPWKVPPCGGGTLPQGLDNSKERSCPHFPPPYYYGGGLACFIARSAPLSNAAGSVDGVHTSRLLYNPCIALVTSDVPRRRPARGAGGTLRRRHPSGLIPVRFPPQGWLLVVSLPPVSIGFFPRPNQNVIKCAP